MVGSMSPLNRIKYRTLFVSLLPLLVCVSALYLSFGYIYSKHIVKQKLDTVEVLRSSLYAPARFYLETGTEEEIKSILNDLVKLHRIYGVQIASRDSADDNKIDIFNSSLKNSFSNVEKYEFDILPLDHTQDTPPIGQLTLHLSAGEWADYTQHLNVALICILLLSLGVICYGLFLIFKRFDSDVRLFSKSIITDEKNNSSDSIDNLQNHIHQLQKQLDIKTSMVELKNNELDDSYHLIKLLSNRAKIGSEKTNNLLSFINRDLMPDLQGLKATTIYSLGTSNEKTDSIFKHVDNELTRLHQKCGHTAESFNDRNYISTQEQKSLHDIESYINSLSEQYASLNTQYVINCLAQEKLGGKLMSFDFSTTKRLINMATAAAYLESAEKHFNIEIIADESIPSSKTLRIIYQWKNNLKTDNDQSHALSLTKDIAIFELADKSNIQCSINRNILTKITFDIPYQIYQKETPARSTLKVVK